MNQSTIRNLLTAVLIVLLLGACAGTQAAQDERAGAENRPAETAREYTSWRDLRASLADELDLPPLEEVVAVPARLPGWMPPELPFWVWLTRPADGSLLFLGSSFPLTSREAEIDRCIENAAAQAARYAGIAAVVSSFRGSFEGGTGFAADTRLFYNQNLIPALTAEAEIRALHQDGSGSYALVRFPSLSGGETEADWEYLAREGDEPLWIASPPATREYYIGIGVAARRLRFSESIESADESAVAEILTQLATTVDVAYDIRREGTGDSSLTEENYQYSTAMVRGIRIVARWRSTDGGYYYSLAMLPRTESR